VHKVSGECLLDAPHQLVFARFDFTALEKVTDSTDMV